MRKNPNPVLYTLFIDGFPVSNHSYPLTTAAVVFGFRAAWATKHGKKTELRPVRRNRKFVR